MDNKEVGPKGPGLAVIVVVAVIVALVGKGGFELYREAAHDSDKKACRMNMQTILNADTAYRVRSYKHVYANSMEQLRKAGDLQPVQCPESDHKDHLADYILATTGNDTLAPVVACRIDSEHGTFTVGCE